MDIIEKEFIGKAIIKGGIHLYKSMDALDVIKRCRQFNRNILGIDSFIVTSNITQPVLEHSIDFSTKGIVGGSWLEAEEFVKTRENSGFLFEIVYE